MLKKVLDVYKIPLLLSLTLSVVLIALKVPREPLIFTQIILGSLIGTFILDLDYIAYAYFLEPETDFSRNLKGFIKHKDLLNALTYLHYQRNSLKDRILNSALFQIVLAGAAIFVTSSNTSFFVKALVISAFVNSIYRLLEEHFENRTQEWFWAIKTKPNNATLYLYLAVMVGILIYNVNIF